MDRVALKLDWCDAKAAKFAVEHWHYSQRMPFGKMVRIGVWENGSFIGCVLFGYSATPNVAKGAGLRQQEIVELTRVALRQHTAPVSRIVSIALAMLRKHCPGLRLVVSFADVDQGHIGGIYQAGNWVYTGCSMEGQKSGYVVRGKYMHCRSAGMKGRNTLDWVRANLDPKATDFITQGKHRYIMPLDVDMRKQIEPLRRPYPKRAGSADSGTSCVQHGGGGANPTSALLHDNAEGAACDATPALEAAND